MLFVIFVCASATKSKKLEKSSWARDEWSLHRCKRKLLKRCGNPKIFLNLYPWVFISPRFCPVQSNWGSFLSINDESTSTNYFKKASRHKIVELVRVPIWNRWPSVNNTRTRYKPGLNLQKVSFLQGFTIRLVYSFWLKESSKITMSFMG